MIVAFDAQSGNRDLNMNNKAQQIILIPFVIFKKVF